MKRIYITYKELLSILFKESPLIVIGTFLSAIIYGLIRPLTIWNTSKLFDLGILVSSDKLAFKSYIPYLILFLVLSILPIVIGSFSIYSFIEPRCQLILRTAYKKEMLKKLKKLEYAHFENEDSMEIIDKAYNRTENAARHLFPMYIYGTISSIIGSLGSLYLFFQVRWWLVLTILIPFFFETYFIQKTYVNIYDELETYWKKERQYTILANMLKSRDYIKENKLFQSSSYLIDTYRSRLANRNREYEKYYFKNLKQHFTKQNITKLTQIVNALILLWLYYQDQLSIGFLITLTLNIFTIIFSWNGLEGCTILFKYSDFHIKSFDYYKKYFALSEQNDGCINTLPDNFSVEFKNVYFKYPNTDTLILKGLSFKINQNEKVSIVGENGEGKTTMIKLLLGLFQPTRGEILVGNKPLNDYSQAVRNQLFGPVFQDFIKYSISLKENIAIGYIDKLEDDLVINAAINKAKVAKFTSELPSGINTILGRDFEGGVDLSGGQWQRIAIARAFMGEKPILILDEPTSQLDPLAESNIYSEFATLTKNKTAIFVTHRLASTVITDRILVISGGIVTQTGSHEELMAQNGLYTKMFNSQKKWYKKEVNDNVN